MNKINYQKLLDKTLDEITKEEKVPKLLLHSCCAPCSSYVIEYLAEYFFITVFYYNPNIDEQEEYEKRVCEQKKLIAAMPVKHPVDFLEGEYNPLDYKRFAEPLREEREGGERCFLCYEMRLRKTAETAKKLGYDFFTTTLSISPMKNAAKLNEIGKSLDEEYHVTYLYSDFKKKEGYKRSVWLSEKYDLYRQDYCGCSYSKRYLKT